MVLHSRSQFALSSPVSAAQLRFVQPCTLVSCGMVWNCVVWLWCGMVRCGCDIVVRQGGGVMVLHIMERSGVAWCGTVHALRSNVWRHVMVH